VSSGLARRLAERNRVALGPVADRCTAAEIDRDARKGKLPSDHAPVYIDLTD
jgi:exodeoxyribonuclease-3